jgi:hypothetical protein
LLVVLFVVVVVWLVVVGVELVGGVCTVVFAGGVMLELLLPGVVEFWIVGVELTMGAGAVPVEFVLFTVWKMGRWKAGIEKRLVWANANNSETNSSGTTA